MDETKTIDTIIIDIKKTKPDKNSVLNNITLIASNTKNISSSLKRCIKKLDNSSDNEDVVEKLTSLYENLLFLVDDIKDVKKDVKKVAKKPRKNNDKMYGIFKPVTCSNEVIKFTGWDPEIKYARLDVYKFLYDYVKSNNLTSVVDKKTVIVPDNALSELLGYDENTDGSMNFFHIPKFLKRQGHFTDN
jgi:chromatin remodeling complex protein RSC6